MKGGVPKCASQSQWGFFATKPDESAGFAERVDFLRWVQTQSASANTIVLDGALDIKATIETHKHIYEEQSPVHHHFSPPQEQAPSQMPMDDLLHEVPKLISRIDSLETDLKQTKLTMGNAIVKLVKKVKKLEGFLKRRNLVLSDSEEEEPEVQGRKSQDDPLDSSVQGLVTPPTTKVNTSGEEQVEEISPNTLEAAKTLSKVASLKPRSIDKGRRYKRRKEAKGKKVVSSLDFQEEVDAGAEQVNTAKGVNTGSIKLSTVSEQLSTGNEQHYTNEDWDLVRAKIEANAELSKSMLGSDLQGKDFAKKMVDLVNQRKKYFAEERARAKRNKPMTQSQLKTYMMNYLKNQGTWKLSQLKKLSFEEVKEEFDKLVKQVESFAPINFEATKASLKRFGEELQTKTPKRLKDDEAKDDEPTKKSGKRRKQMARRGLHTDIDKDDSEGLDEVDEQEESVTGPVWSLLSQQRIISWRYYDTCRVHCLNLESMDIYMLSERKYPLSAEDLLHEDLEQIDDLDIEEMDINWQVSSIECTQRGHYVGKKKRDYFYQHQEAGKQEKNQMGLLTMDDGIVNWGEHTKDEETNHALMAISSSSEQLPLNEKLTFQANEIYEKDEKLKKYRRIGIKAVKENEQLQKTLDLWKDSSKNQVDSTGVIGTSSVHSVDFESEIQSTSEVLSHMIKDCDYYEKKMAKEVEVKKQRVCNTGNMMVKPVWTNTNRINHANQFVPRPVQLNTGRTNINYVRPRVNTVNTNVNTVRSRQPVPTRTSNSFSPKRPQGNWGSVVKTSAGSSTEEHGR
ncbi:hypothetical protein Tco_0569345 [Tanacetum coccineum]